MGLLAPRPSRFTPQERDPVPIVQEAGWAPGPVWTAAENLAPTGIRSQDRPARSESLCRLHYPNACIFGAEFLILHSIYIPANGRQFHTRWAWHRESHTSRFYTHLCTIFLSFIAYEVYSLMSFPLLIDYQLVHLRYFNWCGYTSSNVVEIWL
jgi:hypothetical protein